MVGVPFFLLCQVGPSSRIVWPKCRRCRAGMSSQQVTAVTAKPPTAAAASTRETDCSMQLFLQILHLQARLHGTLSRLGRSGIVILQDLLQFHRMAGLCQQRVTGPDGAL